VRDCDSLILESLYLELLLEKDHRAKIEVMGLPEDVANYLHNFNNKYSLWFADKIKDMAGFQYSKAKINWINVNILTQMQGIMDWVRNVPNVNLKQYTWDQAIDAQREYHDKLQTATLEGQEDNTIIKKYNDGFYWVDLENTRDCSEQQLMGHCASTHKADTLYSLRKYTPQTQTIEAFITIAISPDDGIWYQCKGKRNSKPKEEYYPYIANILIDKEVFKYRYEYDSTHDFTNQDFADYVRSHSNEIANADDILEKLEEDNVGYKDFEKVLKEYESEMDTFSLSIDSDSNGEDDFIRVDGYFQVVIKYNEIDIPNIKELINEHGGEFYGYKDRQNLDDLLYKFDAYPSDGGDVRIEETGEGDSFYVATYLDLSEDSHYSLNDNGVNSFRSLCQSYVSNSKNFDKEEFIERFKIFALLEGWWSNDFSEFTDKVEEGEYKNVAERTTDKNFDFSIRYMPFDNLLFDYRNYDSVLKNLPKIDYLQQKDLGVHEDKFPYAQYLLDYFKYAFNEYLKVSEFSVKGVELMNSLGRPSMISIQETFRYENRKDYNLKKDFEDLKKIDEGYERIKNGYYKLCNDIIIPMLESSRPMTADDVYWKKEEYDERVKELMKDMANVGYTYKDVQIPVYDRETNEEIATVSLGNFSSYGQPTEKELEPEPEQLNAKMTDSINALFQNRYRKYPKYNKELIQNFLKEVFPKQLTFKDYVGVKDYMGEK
jgi:hypothetical protein